MKLRGIVRAGALALGLIAVVASATPASADPLIPFTNDVVDRVKTAGSDTTFPVMLDLASAYIESQGCVLTPIVQPPAAPGQNKCNPPIPQSNIVTTENYDHDVVYNYYPQGSGAGRTQLCQQRVAQQANTVIIDIARSSAGPASSFQCTTANGGVAGTVLRFVAFAKDALTWVYWPGQPAAITNLTQAQLNQIFVTCAITDWQQLGAAASDPINVWSIQSASGSRAVWDGFVGGNSTTCIPAAFKDGSLANGERVIFENDVRPVEVALNDPGAANEALSIFPVGVGAWNSNVDKRSSSLLGDVNGVSPTEANIQAGTFPFSRLLYNVIINAGGATVPLANGAVRRFTNSSSSTNDQTQGWLCKPGQAHSMTTNDTGLGIANPVADRDYRLIVPATLRENGLVPLVPDSDLVSRRCTFTDFTVP